MTRRSPVPAVMLAMLIAGTAGCVVHDAAVPLPVRWSTRVAVGTISAYRATLSPHMHSLGVQCRFRPTCSVYGLESVKKYGAFAGGWRAVKRISRCRASTPLGTYDPP